MAKDEITGKIKQNRSRDKIQYQTSFTDLPIFIAYCAYIENSGRVESKNFSYELAQVRKQFKTWKGDKDTHAALTLQQFGLLYLDNDSYFLSDLGKKFLGLFDEKFSLIKTREDYLEIIVQMINGWHFTENNFDIHPGQIILKLMMEKDLSYYVTSQDIAHIFIYNENKLDTQYDEMKSQIISFRNIGHVYKKEELKKTYTLLTGFVNWDIFVLDSKSNSKIKIVKMKDDFYKLARKKISGVFDENLDESAVITLVEETDKYDSLINKWSLQYGEAGYSQSDQKKRVTQIQSAFKSELIKKNSQKCMLCNITNPELLIASHIKSYEHCESIREKIDENNGLILCANHDKLFDRHLISFDPFTGKILISSALTQEEKNILLINETTNLNMSLLTEKRQSYLIWHNSEFYKKNRS